MKRTEFIKKAILGLGAVSTVGSATSKNKKQEIVGFNHLPLIKDTETMKTILHNAETRGHTNHGWLDTYHSFSFASYYNPDRMSFGALRVLNDDFIAKGMGFGRHPHDNMEIVTIPLYGDLEHKDSMGHTEVIKQYDVQIMSAGTGIYHSEYNKNRDKDVRLLQIWVFPKIEGVKPRYEQKTYLPEGRKNKLQVVVSPDEDDAVTINQDAWFSLGNLDKETELSYTIKKKGNGVYAFLIEGNATVQGQALSRRDALGLWDTEKISIKADSDVEILLMDVPMQA